MYGTPIASLGAKIEAMRRAQQSFSALLDVATTPDRRRLAAAFAAAHATQTKSLWLDITIATVALVLMAILSWRLIRRTVAALQAVGCGVERLARGEFNREITVPSGDELGDLAREANRTAVRLRAYREHNEREDWNKTGLAGLADHIVGEVDPVALGGKAMRYLADYVKARAAVAYGNDERGALRRLDATTGDGAAPRNTARLGAGTIDAAVVDREVHVERGPDGPVIVVPLVHDNKLMGALEFAMPTVPGEQTLELMTRVRGVLGTAFRMAESHARERELLAETQRHALATQVANQELEAFSYSVSHDLRTPLRGIDGFSQALLEDHADHLPPEGQNYLRRIRAAAQRMAELIDDMLRLSRVSRGEFHREPVDLSAIVHSIVADLRLADTARQVEVRAQGDVSASADPRLIRITLENLLGNAWKFTSKTRDPVIEFGVREDAGERVYYVRDNGAGFDMKHAARLFGAFQRLHTDKEFPGTGVGLATVQRIIQRHGGRIWVDAAVGRGATFHFTIPGDSTGGSSS
jgi:signal transduction histidine kinase